MTAIKSFPPRVTGLGDLFPCGAPILNGRCTTGGGTIIDPNVGQLRPTFYGVDARYAALEAQIRESLSHGLQLQGSYTWSKCYDNSSSGDIGDPYQNSLSSLPFFESLDRLALCDFNITHNFVGNWIWDCPLAAEVGFGDCVASGWRMGTGRHHNGEHGLTLYADSRRRSTRPKQLRPI